MKKTLAIIGAFSVWTLVALPVDRYVLRAHFPHLSNLLYFRDATIVIEPFDRTFSWLGLVLVLLLPSVLLGLCSAPVLRFRQKQSWSASLAASGLICFLFLLIFALIFAGHCVYRVAKGVFGERAWAKATDGFCQGFVFKGTLYSYNVRLFHQEASLGALVGLVLGICILYRFGWLRTIREMIK